MNGKRRCTNQGAVIPLVLVMLVTIFAFLALVIDVSFLTGTTVEYKRIADSIALQALKEYQELNYTGNCTTACSVDTSNCGSCSSCPSLKRLCEAMKSAATVGDENLAVAFSESRLENKSSDYSQYIVASENADNNSLATISPGVWYFEHDNNDITIPSSCYTNPSNKSDSTFKPCFREVSIAEAASGAEITAFQVKVGTPVNNQLRTILSNIMYNKSASINAEATAAIVPRRAVFVVDNTISAVTESHPFESNDPLGERILYAYSSTSSDCSTFYRPPEESDPIGSLNLFWLFKLPDSSLTGQPDKTDYQVGRGSFTSNCFRVPYTSAGNIDGGASREMWHRVDVINRPEPLGDILLSVNNGLSAFAERGVGGDRIGFIGFDNEMIEVRATRDEGTGNPFGMVRPIIGGSGEFNTFLRATSPEYGDENGNGVPFENWDAFTSRYLFPRYWSDSSAGGQRQTANTNIPDALEKARAMLNNEEGFRASDNFVVLFSDGQSNCRGGREASPTTDSCGEGNQDFRNSWRDFKINENVLQRYIDNEIAIHSVIVGENSRPHHKLFSAKGSACSFGSEECCMDQETFQQRKRRGIIPADTTWVGLDSGRTFDSPYPDTTSPASFPNYAPNVWQYASEATNGLWLPVRRPCSDFVRSSIGDPVNAAKLAINAICDRGDANDLVSWNSGFVTRFILRGVFQGPDSNIRDNVLDDQGRLLCDPESLSVEEQITNAIQEKILKVSPFILVE